MPVQPHIPPGRVTRAIGAHIVCGWLPSIYLAVLHVSKDKLVGSSFPFGFAR